MSLGGARVFALSALAAIAACAAPGREADPKAPNITLADSGSSARAGAHELWIVGANGVIQHSADAGAHFDVQTSTVHSRLRAVAFTSPAHGVVVGDAGVVLSTEDGGARWHKVEVRDLGSVHLRAVVLAQTWGLGVAVGDNATLLISKDSGRTFTRLQLADHDVQESFVSVSLGETEDSILVGTGSGRFFSIQPPELMP